MKNQIEIQQRFLGEDNPMKLGHLSSDLARIASLLKMKVGEDTIKGVMEEAKLFAEWTGATPGISQETQMFLVKIQNFLAAKEQEWNSSSQNVTWRKELSDCLRAWSEELLKEAGFFDRNE